MKREDAYYYMNLLLLGFSDGYDEWLESYLKTDEPMSDLVIDLYFSGSDVKKIISLLHNYCGEQEFDKSVVSEKFRLFFKEAYHSGRMVKGEVVSTMYKLVNNIGDPGDCYVGVSKKLFGKNDSGITHWHPTIYDVYNDVCAIGKIGNILVIKKVPTNSSVLYMGDKDNCPYSVEYQKDKHNVYYLEAK